eukprot:499974-Pyramimonas_sp.AAC.1
MSDAEEVPTVAVYVTVPNKEAGSYCFNCLAIDLYCTTPRLPLFQLPPEQALQFGLLHLISMYTISGQKVAAALIESKLAACVNMIPGTRG